MSRNYQKPLDWFRGRMAAKLGMAKNLRKRTWHKDMNEDLLSRLREETDELGDALADEFHGGKAEREKIIDEAADVANFAMMIADNLNRRKRRP